MNIAQQIAAQFNNDGQRFTDSQQNQLEVVCLERCEFQARQESTETDRYEFSNGSAIFVAGPCWDIESTDEVWLMSCAE